MRELQTSWLEENRGVASDFELEIMPADWRAGRETQLEKAVQLVMDVLKRVKPAVDAAAKGSGL